MLKIFPYLLLLSICKGQAQSYFPTETNWEKNSWQASKICEEDWDMLNLFLEKEQTKGFILLENGKITIEKYYGSFTQDSIWYWASAGKTLTALLIGIAQEEGKLNINDKTNTYLGSWTSMTSAQEDQITIKHQLNMTTGLDFQGDLDCTLPSCLKYRANPGSQWYYHNAPYTLLDEVLLSATNKNASDYFREKIGSKIGMSGTYIKIGYNNVFFSKVRDMARFGNLLLNQGTWNTTKILGDTDFFTEMISESTPLNPSYGYLTWLNYTPSARVPGLTQLFPFYISSNSPKDLYAAIGRDGQICAVIPSRNIVMIRMGLNPNTSLVPYALLDSISRFIFRNSCNKAQMSFIEDKDFDWSIVGDQIEIHPKNIQNIQVELYDMLGKLIGRSNQSASPFAIEKPKNSGMYHIVIRNEQEILHKKINISD
jgi:CubicO group peptidase (beta-lactamase class C family)